MYGINGIDHLAREGCSARVIAGSYPSGPSSMPSPKIWQMIIGDAIEAYNIPSGILFHMHARGGGQAAGRADQGRHGHLRRPGPAGRAHERTRPPSTSCEGRVRRRDGCYFRAIPVDVAIIRATTADERGNISWSTRAPTSAPLDQALAARNNGGVVIAQVKRLAKSGTLAAQQVRVPGILVDAIVVAPDQMQTTQTRLRPGHQRRDLPAAGQLRARRWGAEKVIARRAAQELRAGEAVNLGFGISALVPRILLEEGLHGDVTWVIEQGAVGGVPLLGFQFGCAANAEAIVPSPQQFTYFQGGGFDRSLLSFLQVDAEGNVNVSRLGARPHVTAGCRRLRRHHRASASDRLQRLLHRRGPSSASRTARCGSRGRARTRSSCRRSSTSPSAAGGRASRARRSLYVTERCVIRLPPTG